VKLLKPQESLSELNDEKQNLISTILLSLKKHLFIEKLRTSSEGQLSILKVMFCQHVSLCHLFWLFFNYFNYFALFLDSGPTTFPSVQNQNIKLIYKPTKRAI